MLRRPAFPPHLRPRVVAADEVILPDEREARLLRGPACGLIADLVDGRRTADEIVDALDGQAAPETVYYALETLVVDMTRPETGFPVVRVVAPGLRPAWARLGPGRLYDVPVALGWLAGPLSERDLNPVPFALRTATSAS